MSTRHPKTNTFSLNASDNERLIRLAPLYDLTLVHNDPAVCVIQGLRGAGAGEQPLAAHIAYRRLLVEICAKAAPWVHFHLAESCRDSLLNLSDARLSRVAELYARDRDARTLSGRAMDEHLVA